MMSMNARSPEPRNEITFPGEGVKSLRLGKFGFTDQSPTGSGIAGLFSSVRSSTKDLKKKVSVDDIGEPNAADSSFTEEMGSLPLPVDAPSNLPPPPAAGTNVETLPRRLKDFLTRRNNSEKSRTTQVTRTTRLVEQPKPTTAAVASRRTMATKKLKLKKNMNKKEKEKEKELKKISISEFFGAKRHSLTGVGDSGLQL